MPSSFPGKPPSWGAGAKTAIGTAAGAKSRVWFTIGRNCLTEIYYPRPDYAHCRELFLVVTNGADFFSDERENVQSIRMTFPGVPLYEAESQPKNGEYRLSKTTFADPFRNVVLQRVRILDSQLPGPLRLWVVFAPALANAAFGNSGWAIPEPNALVTARAGVAAALMPSCGFSEMTCNFQGPCDGYNQLRSKRILETHTANTHDGNILMVGELDYRGSPEGAVLALGFAEFPQDAIQAASDSLAANFDDLSGAYVKEWREQRRSSVTLSGVSTNRVCEASVAALQCHLSKQEPRGIVASLGAPWGETLQKNTGFRYQLSWTRDAVEAATAFLALDQTECAKSLWNFLVRTQEDDGHWPQNMWLDGTPHWTGIQMDETAQPILLAEMLHRLGAIQHSDAWPTVRRAAEYIVRNGPRTEQDRWEEGGGYSPYTIAVEIVALLAAAEFADEAGEADIAVYMRDVADLWNDNLEEFTYRDGRYVRLSTAQTNRTGELKKMIIRSPRHADSTAVLALVRYGLRSADDPRILQTVERVDRRLKSSTASGVVWHRFPEDNYGEYDDGSPFDGNGVGRGWPLLAGERAHYEIARGNFDEARRLAEVMENQASECGFLPEQVWDSADLPARGLFNGRPTGSAMPLAWAHAEYLKLLRSLRDGKVFDMPPQAVERYQKGGVSSRYALWRTNHKTQVMSQGKILRVEWDAPVTIYWTADGWKNVQAITAADSGLGIYYADLPTASQPAGAVIGFTLFWRRSNEWENQAYELRVEATPKTQ